MYVLQAVKECKKVIREFKADVVVGTGGYASFPALMAATMLKVPTCVHEANAMPGLTTRMIADRVDRVLTCFPESAKHYRHPERVETVGMPVRREFIFTKKEAEFYENLEKFYEDADRPHGMGAKSPAARSVFSNYFFFCPILESRGKVSGQMQAAKMTMRK